LKHADFDCRNGRFGFGIAFAMAINGDGSRDGLRLAGAAVKVGHFFFYSTGWHFPLCE